MTTELDPIVGNWYRHVDKGQAFMVVAIDELDQLVEVQHFDGDIEEISLSNWHDMELELSEAPEDWSGPVDNVEHDDAGYTETRMSSDAWTESLENNPRTTTEDWQETRAEDERDDGSEGTMLEETERQDRLENTVLASVDIVEPGESEESEQGD